jgi:predicted esterase
MTTEEAAKQLRLSVPSDLLTVRGILVVANYNGGDSRDYYDLAWYSEFMSLHGFAFLGANGSLPHAEGFQAMQRALAQLARDSGHPELLNAPYATTGFSAGGGFASYLLVAVPDRVIASVPYGSRLKLPAKPSAASLGTPACVISETTEHPEDVVEPVLEAFRPEGALFGWMSVQGHGHEMCGQEVLAMPLLDAAVRLRYPPDGDVRRGAVQLRRLDPDSGWVADNTTFRSGLTRICPAKGFTGPLGRSS